MKHLLTLKDLAKDEILDIINLGIQVKLAPHKFYDKLRNKTLALLFQKTSTRTRMSFEAGMIQLGGHAIFLDWRTTNLTLGQLTDEIQCMDKYVDCIMARVYEHSDLELMASYSRVPIINGLSDSFHPCQALADLMLIFEKFKDPQDIKVAFIGDGSNNVASSLAIGCAKLGIKINIGSPAAYSIREDVKGYLKKNHLDDFVKEFNNPFEAVEDAIVIYTDTWVSMGQESEKERRVKIFEDYQVNMQLVKYSKFEPIVMHCLPAHRDYEITSEVLDSKYSVVFEQAENRMHVQKAILLRLLSAEHKGSQKSLF
ncbi:MAG: ornithine carbamoyltransferase [Promethearchaeota archaeon]